MKNTIRRVDSKHFDPIVEGMYRAVMWTGGSARMARIEGIDICGKTGTAQNPHGADHSTFMGVSAPRNNPKIAVSVYVENGRWGGIAAAAVASLLTELYLTDTVHPSAAGSNMSKPANQLSLLWKMT